MVIFNNKLKGEYQYNNFCNVLENLNKNHKNFLIFWHYFGIIQY